MQYGDHQMYGMSIRSSQQAYTALHNQQMGAKNLHLAKRLEYKNRYTPEQQEEYSKEIDEIIGIIADNKWPKKLEDYWKWKYSEEHKVNDWAEVQEIEIDKMQYWQE